MKSARMRQKARGRKVGIERVLYSVSYSSKIAIKYFYKREGGLHHDMLLLMNTSRLQNKLQ